jgi:alkaline phosphatase D
MKFSLSVVIIACSFITNAQVVTDKVLTRVAFGSCSSQDKDMPIWDTIAAQNPDLFIMLGDNIYGDTKDMNVLQAKYNKLGAKPGFQRLKQKCPIIATWDDHDYGVNDGGKEYPMKEESKKIFLNFFNEPKESDRWKHEGIYTSYMFGPTGKKIQIIMLDLRTFRDSICLAGEGEDCVGEYKKCEDSTKTMLGAAQWAWLEKELQKPADYRIIGSSTQFLVDFNGWEAWVNLPYERERFINLLKKTRTSGAFFISGDLHYAELSKLKRNGQPPIYDLTSSGLTHGHNCAGENVNRIYGAYMSANFGMLTFNWGSTGGPTMLMEIKGEKGDTKIKHLIPLKELQF